MTGNSVFDVVLRRLMGRRSIDLQELSRRTGIAEAKLESVLGGVVPSPSVLRKLAQTLDLHAADL